MIFICAAVFKSLIGSSIGSIVYFSYQCCRTKTDQDKKMNGSPEGELYNVDLKESKDLSPIKDKEKEHLIREIKRDIDSDKWGVQYAAIESLRRYIVSCPGYIKNDM